MAGCLPSVDWLQPRVMISREPGCLCVRHCRPRPAILPSQPSLSAVMPSLPRSLRSQQATLSITLSSPIRVHWAPQASAQPQTLGCRQGRRTATPELDPQAGSLEPICSLCLAPPKSPLDRKPIPAQLLLPPCHLLSVSRLGLICFKMSCSVWPSH